MLHVSGVFLFLMKSISFQISHNVFSFEFENDDMEQSKHHSFISLFFILNCLSKTLVRRNTSQ